jgi:hypothetical protein
LALLTIDYYYYNFFFTESKISILTIGWIFRKEEKKKPKKTTSFGSREKKKRVNFNLSTGIGSNKYKKKNYSCYFIIADFQ